MKRVVITGMGIYSTLGKDLEEVQKSLYEGKSGIVYESSRKEMGFRSGLTASLETPNLKPLLSRRMRTGMPVHAEYAYLSARQALQNAQMDPDYAAKNSTGIICSNDSCAQPIIEGWEKFKAKQDTTLMGSGTIFRQMNSTVSMNLSVIFKLTGINLTVSGACAGGTHAAGLAWTLIRHGMQERVICCGAQELNPESVASFDGLSAFSVREKDPAKASRPFDKDRDGLVPGGGAACLVIESYESAKKRSAPILGEIVGYGFSSNGEHISSPNLAGLETTMQMALKNAGIKASEIDYINAHATSTPVGDAKEAQAIYNVFGEKIPVSSTKSMTGHEMWMGGVSEIVYSLLMSKNQFIAPNINFENPDEFSQKLNIISKTKTQKITRFLSNSFGFGGTNASIIIQTL